MFMYYVLLFVGLMGVFTGTAWVRSDDEGTVAFGYVMAGIGFYNIINALVALEVLP